VVGGVEDSLEVNISPLIGAWGPSHFIAQVVVASRGPDEVRTFADCLKEGFGRPKGSPTISNPVGVSIEGELVELRVCSESKVKDFLNELFGIVVNSEVDSVARSSVGKVESERDVLAALVHVVLFGFIFVSLEHSSRRRCPRADHVVVGEFGEKFAWSGHRFEG